MFVTVLNKTVAGLEAIPDFKTVDIWQGEIKELLETPTKLPAAFVIFGRSDFGLPATIGATVAPADMLWPVIVMSQNLRDRKSGAVESLGLLMKVVAPANVPPPQTPGLTRLDTGYGYLWTDSVELISVAKGVAAYGFKFFVRKE